MQQSYILDRGLTYLVEDIANATQRVVAHDCAARGLSDRGVTNAVRDAWPDAFALYSREISHGIKLGEVVWATPSGPGEDKPVIAHMITQERLGLDGSRHTSYDAVDTALRNVARRAHEQFNTTEIAIPMIGASFGCGARWDVIRPILLSVQSYFKMQFVIYNKDEERLKRRLSY